MGKIVYHGTFVGTAPHNEWNRPTFHAGTMRSALDRLQDNVDAYESSPDIERQGGIGVVHGYEIEETAPISKEKWSDPDTDYEDFPRVPEYDVTRIHSYENEQEDPGSTSYVIPSQFIRQKHVRHLGPQFKQLIGRGGESIAKAATIMVGGRYEAPK